ncbi:MAG: aldose 1-epimerase family protein [Eubacteriales bacterium]|nr:aldose 1-epimerase family protein [Eubacteriales bacterium]
MSQVSIHNDKLSVTVSTTGAELQSIQDWNGVERLWQGDPKFWANRAPILFPVAGGFRDDCYELDGKRYPMPKHGFVRKAEWRLESESENEVTFVTDQKDEGFPFEYELRARYSLTGPTLMVTYSVTNKDKVPFYFSVGAHEAYATPEGIEEYEIVFDGPEKLDNYVLDGNLIKRDPVVMAENAKKLPLRYEYFAVDALVFRTLKSRGVTLRSAKHDREIRVDFPEHDTLMFWTKPGAGYICIEPWCNAPDFVDADYRIDRKPGFIKLAPGETAGRRHTITIR